tara:strand:- start:92 stop:265 length:174 start_codon:yes stop_codon:yes gene_type:complete
MNMENEIIEFYRNAGYTPEQTIKELCMILGCSMLTANKLDVEYLSSKIEVKVSVKYK